MDGSKKLEAPKDMFNTGRRTHISTSELGLYSDHSDYYNTTNYSATVRKLVIGIMVIVSVILIGIFLYDFASSASITSKVNQETKHIYILQNSLRKSNIANRKSSVTLAPTIYIVNSSNASVLEDRVDDDPNLVYKDVAPEKSKTETREQRMAVDELESRAQNLKNFKLRKTLLDRQHSEDDGPVEEKQMIDNHAMIYRVRNQHPEYSNEEIIYDENQRATPFRFELKGPHPASFKRPKYPQLTQYGYPHSSRNIQDIIKYLTNDPETLNRGIKFTGFYVNPKKYDTGHMDIGEVAMNSDQIEQQENAPYAISFNTDPLYQYKPKHPADVNLLATTNLRFSPMGIHRYNSYHDPYYQKPNSNKQTMYQQNQYDSVGSYGTANYGKRRKPKPFSVMLDIYPITDMADQTKKSSRLKLQIASEEADPRRPFIPFLPRYPKAYGMYTQPPIPSGMTSPPQQAPEEEEKHQMILHLNLYPKRKSKLTRNDVIERSEMLPADEKEQLIDRMLVPFDAIAKHLADHAAVEEAKLDGDKDLADALEVRYEETSLVNERPEFVNRALAQKLVGTTQINEYTSGSNSTNSTNSAFESITVTMATTVIMDSTTTTVQTKTLKNENSTTFKDIDTIEGFQQFADSLIAMD